MDNFDHFRKAAEAAGYELAHGEESYGEKSFGVMILVKLGERKVCGDRGRPGFDEDGITFYKAADLIKTGLQTTSAKLDPEGPATRERHKYEIAGIYLLAGVDAIYMEPLPNGYCSQPCCLNKPWFRVTSRIGHVVVGWRKRVISIDWKDSTVKKSGQELFPAEDVTRWETGIHAYGVEKAAEYVRRLHEGA